jgi:hypothetical protein
MNLKNILMNKLELTKEEARNIVWGDARDKYATLKQEVESTSRWSIFYNIVIQDRKSKKYYHDVYSVGATESQEKSPYDRVNPNFIEVFPHTIKTTVYKLKPQDEV